MHIEVNGWNEENEAVSASGDYSIGTAESDAVAEVCRVWGIVTISDTKVSSIDDYKGVGTMSTAFPYVFDADLDGYVEPKLHESRDEYIARTGGHLDVDRWFALLDYVAARRNHLSSVRAGAARNIDEANMTAEAIALEDSREQLDATRDLLSGTFRPGGETVRETLARVANERRAADDSRIAFDGALAFARVRVAYGHSAIAAVYHAASRFELDADAVERLASLIVGGR